MFAIGNLLAALAFAPLLADAPPLPQAHAHNDYNHARPLLDALDHGFCNVEADVFLIQGELLVGHSFLELKAGRTLASLYLDPLLERVKANGGRVFKDGPIVTLLVDFKSAAEPTYARLNEILPKYAEMLGRYENGQWHEGAVRVVISGNRPFESVGAQENRYVGLDGRTSDLGSDAPAHLMPMISDQWGSQFRWRGEGPMPGEEREKLREIVATAHGAGRVVRFWATPESEAVWSELADAGVDLINTDELARLQRFLLAREVRGQAKPADE